MAIDTIKTPSGDVLMVVGIGAMFLAYAIKSHGKTPFDAEFERAGEQYNIEPDFLRAIAKTENDKLDPNVVSKANKNGSRDYGLMQINNNTAKRLGVTDLKLLMDPAVSIRLAATWLAMMRLELGKWWSPWTWASAYNVGSDDVIRTEGGITNPTYVAKVMYHYQLYKMGKVV